MMKVELGATRQMITARFAIGFWVLEPVPFAVLVDDRSALDVEPRQFLLGDLDNALAQSAANDDRKPGCGDAA